MTCEGCSGAVKRILGKMDGVTEVNADVEAKLVTIEHSDDVTPEAMNEALQKWSAASGKSVELKA
jgi:copper chaperone